MRRSRRSALCRCAAVLTCVLAVVAGMSACANPRGEAATAQALSAAADEIGGLRNDVSQIQSDLDSLRQVVAHQDTVISRLAALNNIPR